MKAIKINTFLLLISMVINAQTADSNTVNMGDLTIASDIDVSSVGLFNNTVNANLVNDGNLYLYSHYHNDGLVTFTLGSTTGTTLMYGTTGFQEISGTSAFEMNNVDFYNTGSIQPAFHLSAEMRVFGDALFQKGIIESETYGGVIIFEDNATQKLTNNASYVHGNVLKMGNDAFHFPVGAGGYYRYAGISAPDNPLDSFTGTYFLANSGSLYPLDNKEDGIQLINDAEYWEIDKRASNSDILLTLSWSESTTPSAIYATPVDEIHIVRWDALKNLWVDEGGAANTTAKEVTMVIDKLTNYGIFTLARVKINAVADDFIIYNAISPNEDGLNEYFKIEGIKNHTNNTVEIYNRWGIKVFETTSYDTNGNVFKGFSNGRATVNSNQKLPSGAYFYIINVMRNDSGESFFKKAGYLQINDN
jgi:gliding motility-associated-like protein